MMSPDVLSDTRISNYPLQELREPFSDADLIGFIKDAIQDGRIIEACYFEGSFKRLELIDVYGLKSLGVQCIESWDVTPDFEGAHADSLFCEPDESQVLLPVSSQGNVHLNLKNASRFKQSIKNNEQFLTSMREFVRGAVDRVGTIEKFGEDVIKIYAGDAREHIFISEGAEATDNFIRYLEGKGYRMQDTSHMVSTTVPAPEQTEPSTEVLRKFPRMSGNLIYIDENAPAMSTFEEWNIISRALRVESSGDGEDREGDKVEKFLKAYDVTKEDFEEVRSEADAQFETFITADSWKVERAFREGHRKVIGAALENYVATEQDEGFRLTAEHMLKNMASISIIEAAETVYMPLSNSELPPEDEPEASVQSSLPATKVLPLSEHSTKPKRSWRKLFGSALRHFVQQYV